MHINIYIYVYIYVYMISHWVIAYHRIAFMGNSTNSWLFYLTWTVNIMQIVLMLSSIWTGNNAALVYHVWYTSFCMCLIYFQDLKDSK